MKLLITTRTMLYCLVYRVGLFCASCTKQRRRYSLNVTCAVVFQVQYKCHKCDSLFRNSKVEMMHSLSLCDSSIYQSFFNFSFSDCLSAAHDAMQAYTLRSDVRTKTTLQARQHRRAPLNSATQISCKRNISAISGHFPRFVPFFVRMRSISTFCPKICLYRRPQQRRFPICELKFWQYNTTAEIASHVTAERAGFVKPSSNLALRSPSLFVRPL